MIKLKEVLNAKKKEAGFLEGEVAKQCMKGFDTAIRQVKFLYSDLDISTYGNFKEIRDGQLVDKPLPSNNPVGTKVVDQTRPFNNPICFLCLIVDNSF